MSKMTILVWLKGEFGAWLKGESVGSLSLAFGYAPFGPKMEQAAHKQRAEGSTTQRR